MSLSLYEQIYQMDNLYLASKKAMKGKKSKSTVAKFWFYEDEKLAHIHELLKHRKYKFGRYTEFTINDNSVMRKISAAPFVDRVVHHAIMNVIEPLFEKSFIYDTYANRKGKGTLSALRRAKYYANKYEYILKIDIKKYFPSIDHEILITMIEKKIACDETMQLLIGLIENSNKQEDAFFYFSNDTLLLPYERRKGIPLGNLTSQFFGNWYLNEFDHYVKEKLKVKGYIRYVDDMTFFSNSKAFLEDLILVLDSYLSAFRLKVHPYKTILQSTKEGFVFLGHKVYATHFRLTSKALNRGRKNLKKVKYEYRYNKIDLQQAKNRIFGSIGFFKMGKNSYMIDELLVQTSLCRSV
jgi:retron-type reverse transcriptase